MIIMMMVTMMMITMMMVTMITVTMMMVMIITKTTTGIPHTNISCGRGLHHDDHHISILKFGPHWTGQTSGGRRSCIIRLVGKALLPLMIIRRQLDQEMNL